jgi:hypothetical protein
MLQVSSGILLALSGVVAFAALAATSVLVAILAPAARGTAIAVAVALSAWWGITFALAVAGVTSFALFGLRVLAPLVIGTLALVAFEPLRRLLSRPELLPSLIALQTYRVIGAIWLVLLALGALPPLFAVPAGIGDVLTGVTAIWAARSLRAGRIGRAVAWNLFGLLDLAVALTTGAIAGPAALTVLPLVLIPTFGVPLSILLHAVSLRSLAATRRPAVRALSA